MCGRAVGLHDLIDSLATQRPVRATRQTMPLTVDFTTNRIAAAVRKALLSGFAFGVLAVAAPPVLAQASSAAGDDSRKQPASPAAAGVATLPTVTVTGNEPMPAYSGGQVATGGRMGFLGGKDFMETPFSTITYTDKYIADQQAQDIQSVISKTDPTVFTSGIAGEALESYSIRGLPSDVGDVTVNGLPGMADYWRTSPEMFERVEVLKGPSALLNGMPPKGSAGGAVNFVTKRAGDEPLTRLTGTYMSDSHFGGHIDLGRRFGESKQFGIRLNGAYRDGDTALKDQKKKVSQVALGLDWRGERARVSADLYHGTERGDGLTRGLTLSSGLAVPKPPKPEVSWNPPWSFFDLTEKGAMLRGEFDLTDQLMAYAAAGISKSEIDTLMGVPQVFNEAGDFSINYSGVSDRMERKSAEVGLTGKARTGSVGHQFALNATYYTEDYLLRGYRNVLPQNWVTNIYSPVWGPAVARPDNIPALTQTDTRLTSFGLADTLSFAEDRVQLTLGVRRQEVVNDSFNGATGARIGQRYKESATTPAVAILLKATDSISVYANYIEGLSQGAMAPIPRRTQAKSSRPTRPSRRKSASNTTWENSRIQSACMKSSAQAAIPIPSPMFFRSVASSATGAWSGASSAR